MSSASDIIAKMPADVRKRTEAEAAAAGKSLEAYVQANLVNQVTDDDLEGVSGGVRLEVAADFDP